MNSKTQLINVPKSYDTKNMLFSDPVEGSVPNSTIKYKRVLISTVNPDGTVGDLVIKSPKVFSFGVSENRDPETKMVKGYTLPLCLWNLNGASQEEKDFCSAFDDIVEECKNHVLEHKEDIEKYELDRSDLKKFHPFYWKKEKGKPIPGQGPVLYVKLIENKKQGTILSMFFDTQDNSVNPIDLIGKYLYAEAAIKVESIYVGTRVALQVKLHEATVELVQTGMSRLLPRPKAVDRLITGDANPLLSAHEDTKVEGTTETKTAKLGNEDEKEDSDGSINEEHTKPKPKKPVIKRKKVTVRRKVKPEN